MKKIIQITILGIILIWNVNLQAQTNVVSDEINEFKDQIVVINICNPKEQDVNEVQKLNTLVEKYKDKNVRFLAITDYESLESNEMLYSVNFNYQHYTGKNANKIFDKFQTGMYKVYPIHIIINQKGNVVFKKRKYTKNMNKKLSKKINTLLKLKK